MTSVSGCCVHGGGLHHRLSPCLRLARYHHGHLPHKLSFFRSLWLPHRVNYSVHALSRTLMSTPPGGRLCCGRNLFNLFSKRPRNPSCVISRLYRTTKPVGAGNAGKTGAKSSQKLPQRSEIRRLLELAKSEKYRLSGKLS